MKNTALHEEEGVSPEQGPLLHSVQLEELHRGEESGQALLADRIGLFGSVKAKVSAQIGYAEATISELLDLKEGAVLNLDRTVDTPIDLWVEGRLIARGHLAVVGDHFAVMVSEVAKPALP